MIDRFVPARFRHFVSVLQTLVSVWEMHAFVALLIAFGVAVTVTWLLNRFYTFRVERRHNLVEWFKYTGVNSAGGMIHLVAYGVVILLFSILQLYPLIPLVISSAVAAVFNYSMSANLVFDTGKGTETDSSNNDG